MSFYTVCPFHTDSFGAAGQGLPRAEYVERVQEHARWADRHGVRGMVMYSFNTSVDPWATAALVAGCTERLRPVVTLLPFHHHPYIAARAVASFAYVFGRPVELNLVAGASPSELARLGETSGPERLTEFVRVLRALFEGTCNFHGEHYEVVDAALPLTIDERLRPRCFIPGSSARTGAAVRAVADSSLLMAKPLAQLGQELAGLADGRPDLRHAMIVGLVARPTADEAWAFAREQYGGDARGRVASRLFVSRASSGQHRANVEIARGAELHDDILWYGASKIGIDCPKLVGSYAEVRAALDRYAALGVTDVVIDLPPDLQEYEHIGRVVEPLIKEERT